MRMNHILRLLLVFLACVIAGRLAVANAEERPATLSPRAMFAEAMALYTGAAGRVDEPKAKKLLLEAGRRGDPLAKMWVARCYYDGVATFPWDRSRARKLAEDVTDEVERLAAEQDREAAFVYGAACDVGLGVDVNAG